MQAGMAPLQLMQYTARLLWTHRIWFLGLKQKLITIINVQCKVQIFKLWLAAGDTNGRNGEDVLLENFLTMLSLKLYLVVILLFRYIFSSFSILFFPFINKRIALAFMHMPSVNALCMTMPAVPQLFNLFYNHFVFVVYP